MGVSRTILFRDQTHNNILLHDLSLDGLAVQANHQVVVHDGASLILDPGGARGFPGIASGVNGWLTYPSALAYVSSLWLHFAPHADIAEQFEYRLRPLPDECMWLKLNGAEPAVVPTHSLPLAGNYHLYEPLSKVFCSGDLGCSLGSDYREIQGFDAHVPCRRGFHQRYMASNAAIRARVRMVRKLKIDSIGPQHGALFRGPAMIDKLLAWLAFLTCGVERLPGEYLVSQR